MAESNEKNVLGASRSASGRSATSGEARLLDVVHSALETADMIERFHEGHETETSTHLCEELRAFARDISKTVRQTSAQAPQEARYHGHHSDANRESIDRKAATHATPVGSGGMGPFMNLAPSEERAIDWGENLRNRRSDADGNER